MKFSRCLNVALPFYITHNETSVHLRLSFAFCYLRARVVIVSVLQKIVFICFLLIPQILLADVTTKVDRNTVYQGQKLTLTIETDQADEIRPDLRPLQPAFNILGSRKVNVSSHSTGSVTNKTRWQLQLRPLSDGEQVIPSLQIGQERSTEIAISVLPAEDNPNFSSTGRSLFLELELNQDEIYLNAQAILKAKVFHLRPLPLDATLNLPQSDDLLIKMLEEQKQYTEIVRGQNFTVTETSYALFPNKEGLLEIDSITFTATQPGETLVELSSEPLILVAKPPAYKNSNNIWLPASSLAINDSLAEVTGIPRGEPLIRKISLEADGLPASVLPSIFELGGQQSSSQLLNVTLEETQTEHGISSTRIEEIQLRADQIGEMSLPAVDIPWWNTGSETGQTATLPEKVVKIAEGPAKASAPTQHSSMQNGNTGGSSNLLIWLLTGISIISTLGCIYSFSKLRSIQKDSQEKEQALEFEQHLRQQATSAIAEKNTFQALSMACNQNNPEIAQLRLIEWGQSFWNDSNLINLELFCEKANNQTINFLVLDLEQHLYGSSSEPWQGDLLLEAIERIRFRQQRQFLDLEEGDEKFSYIT